MMLYFGCSVFILLWCSCRSVLSQHHGFTGELPQFYKEPYNLTAFVGETARLTCSVTHLAGNQAVAWMKLNPTSSFLTSGHQSFASEEGKLVVVGEHTEGDLQFNLLINNVTEKDAGEYICTVVEFGELNYRRWRRSQKATVSIIRPTPKPTLKCIADPHASHLHSGVHLRLGCKLDGAGPRDTRISMNWTRNDMGVVARTRFEGIQFGGGTHSPELVHMFKVTTADRGHIFTCSVEYDHHNGTGWITVQDQCHIDPLHVKPYSNLVLTKRAMSTVDVGQEVRFVCPVNAPKPGELRLRAFTWNIVPTIVPSRFRLSHHGDELIIRRIIAEDDGLMISCFVPPLTAGTSKRELYLRVRHPDKNLLWESRHPEVVVPFGPAALVLTTSPSHITDTTLPSNESSTDPPATVTPGSVFNDSLTMDSGTDQHRAYPLYKAGNASNAETLTTPDTQTNETSQPGLNVGNLTIAFQLIPPASVTEPNGILSVIESTSLSTSSGSQSTSGVGGTGGAGGPGGTDRTGGIGGTGDADGGSDTNTAIDDGGPYVEIPSFYEHDEYNYDIDLIGQNINRTAIAPSDLSSSDFIFIFVMIAEVILTILLVVLLLVTGPVCFASKRNKDQTDTNETDVEKNSTPPVPMRITEKKDPPSHRQANEVVLSSNGINLMTSERAKPAPGLTRKDIPTVDITLSFEMKGKRREMDTSEIVTVSESVKDGPGSDASTVEFTTFGYPRSENSSEA